jgi:hypothetical protein
MVWQKCMKKNQKNDKKKKRRRKRKAKKHTDYHPVSFMFKLRKCQEKYKKSW